MARNTPYTDIDWDDGVYGTGRTQPPKNRGGLIAVLLILIIFLCGLITVLGVMNVRLFQQLQDHRQDDLLMAFSGTTDQAPQTLPVQAETQPAAASFSVQPREGSGFLSLESAPQGVENFPEEGAMSLQDIYSRNLPSVVSISTPLATGTGVILSADGYIVTNAHVVEDAPSVTVALSDQREFPARLVGRDEVSDLAVLSIAAGDLVPARFADSSTLRVGDKVVAIGDPLGASFRGTYTDGIISGIDRDVGLDGRSMTLIQTNAALNAGNSGGPLINCYGQVIGINTMKIGAFADQAGVEGLGFAIPSTTVKEIVDQLIAQGYVSGRPTLGLEGDRLATFYQRYYRMPDGMYLTGVDPDSDAYAKGIREGDILLKINGASIGTMDQLRSAIGSFQVGDSVQATVYHAGQTYLLELTLSESTNGS